MAVGKLFFAWIAADEVFDPAVHAREDEDVFSVRISEAEGEFALATVEIRNPRAGLLSPARLQRCFISAEIVGKTSTSTTLLFAGRVVGIPVGVGRETVELEFIGRPDDWSDLQSALLEELKASPRHHAALVSDETDLTQVLEGFAGLPQWSRTTGMVKLADIDATRGLSGSYETTLFDLTNSALEDSLDVTVSGSPLSAVKVELDVSWTQSVPVFSVPLSADPGFGVSGFLEGLFGGRPATLTGEDFASSWPTQGSALDGGWSVLSAYLLGETDGFVTRHVDVAEAAPRAAWAETTYPVETPITRFYGNLVLQGRYEQPRREVLSLTVAADVQPLVEPPEPEVLQYSVDGAAIAPEAEKIVSTTYREYDAATLDYVTRQISYRISKGQMAYSGMAGNPGVIGPVLTAALARAEARLRAAARCVEVSIDLTFEKTLALDTSSVVRLTDDRLPGGSANGKVTSVELYADGDGQCFGRVSFACSVGRAAVLAAPTATVEPYAVPGEPAVVSYCRDFGNADDGSRAFISASVVNGLSQQSVEIQELDLTLTANRFAGLGYRWAQNLDDAAARQAIEERLAEIPTELALELVSLEPTDETLRTVTATPSGPVQLFRGIDLEA